MANIIFLLISFIIYIVILLYCIKKAEDISQNPEKYSEIPGWEQYLSSFWYETEDKKFFISKHHIASIIVIMPIWLIFIGGYYFFTRLIQNQFFIPDGTAQLFTQNVFLGVIACLFFAVGISFWVPFQSKAPIFIACSLYAFNPETKRSKAWKNTIITMTVFSALCLPFMTLAVNTYAYADENKIAENKIFQVIESENLL